MGANKVNLKKTLLCVATVSALTMIAGGSTAATNDYSLQYNGFGVKAEYADYASEHSHFFIGGNFVNHGPTEKEWLFRLFGETGSSMVPWSRSELAREKDAAKFPS